MKIILVLNLVLASGFALFAQQAECGQADVTSTIEQVKGILAADRKLFYKLRVGIAHATSCYNAWNRHLAHDLLIKLESEREKALTKVLNGVEINLSSKQLIAELNKVHKEVAAKDVKTISKLLLNSCEDDPADGLDLLKRIVRALKKFSDRGIPKMNAYGSVPNSDDFEIDEEDFYDETETDSDEYNGNVAAAIKDEREALERDKLQFEDIAEMNELEKAFRRFEKIRRAQIEEVLNNFDRKLSAKEFRRALHARHQQAFEDHEDLLTLIEHSPNEYSIMSRFRLTTYLFERKRAVIKGMLWMNYENNDSVTSDFINYYYDYGY